MSFHFWRNRGTPGKDRYLSLQNGYHGETVGALSVTDVALFKDAYAPLLRPSATVPSPDWRLAEAGESAQDYAVRCAQALESCLEASHPSIAAFIVEPLVQCAAGMAMHHPEYLRRARALCDRYQVHLIADEIAVGCGRTGSFFAHEQAGIAPDFLCLSKGLSGGYLPLSVVLATDAVFDAFYDDDISRGFLHSHSYTGNTLACRAALATLAIFDEDRVIEANERLARAIAQACRRIQEHPRVRHFRQSGMIWAFDVDDAGPEFSRRFHTSALEQELLLRPLGNTVYFMPPYVITPDEAELLASRTHALLDRVDRRSAPSS